MYSLCIVFVINLFHSKVSTNGLHIFDSRQIQLFRKAIAKPILFVAPPLRYRWNEHCRDLDSMSLVGVIRVSRNVFLNFAIEWRSVSQFPTRSDEDPHFRKSSIQTSYGIWNWYSMRMTRPCRTTSKTVIHSIQLDVPSMPLRNVLVQ